MSKPAWVLTGGHRPLGLIGDLCSQINVSSRSHPCGRSADRWKRTARSLQLTISYNKRCTLCHLQASHAMRGAHAGTGVTRSWVFHPGRTPSLVVSALFVPHAGSMSLRFLQDPRRTTTLFQAKFESCGSAHKTFSIDSTLPGSSRWKSFLLAAVHGGGWFPGCCWTLSGHRSRRSI